MGGRDDRVCAMSDDTDKIVMAIDAQPTILELGNALAVCINEIERHNTHPGHITDYQVILDLRDLHKRLLNTA